MRQFLVLLGFSLWISITGAQVVFNTAELVKKINPSVVLIKGSVGGGYKLGSGFIISGDGEIVTNVHVLKDIKMGAVRLASGDVYDVFSVLAFDERRDLAIIKISGFDLPSLELGNSNTIQPGEPVLLVGSPLGLEGTISSGLVSAVREIGGVKLIQTDSAASPGSSGGPLVNARGEVIGVLRSKVEDAENLNFAVPSNYVSAMLHNLQSPTSLEEMQGKLGKSPDLFAEQRPSKEGQITGRVGQLTGTVYMIDKEKSTITITNGYMQRQIVYNSDTKWLYGTQEGNRPSSLDELKGNWYLNCKGTFDGVRLFVSACRFRESK
jgi:S1-C subfamily serine protease